MKFFCPWCVCELPFYGSIIILKDLCAFTTSTHTSIWSTLRLPGCAFMQWLLHIMVLPAPDRELALPLESFLKLGSKRSKKTEGLSQKKDWHQKIARFIERSAHTPIWSTMRLPGCAFTHSLHLMILPIPDRQLALSLESFQRLESRELRM